MNFIHHIRPALIDLLRSITAYLVLQGLQAPDLEAQVFPDTTTLAEERLHATAVQKGSTNQCAETNCDALPILCHRGCAYHCSKHGTVLCQRRY